MLARGLAVRANPWRGNGKAENRCCCKQSRRHNRPVIVYLAPRPNRTAIRPRPGDILSIEVTSRQASCQCVIRDCRSVDGLMPNRCLAAEASRRRRYVGRRNDFLENRATTASATADRRGTEASRWSRSLTNASAPKIICSRQPRIVFVAQVFDPSLKQRPPIPRLKQRKSCYLLRTKGDKNGSSAHDNDSFSTRIGLCLRRTHHRAVLPVLHRIAGRSCCQPHDHGVVSLGVCNDALVRLWRGAPCRFAGAPAGRALWNPHPPEGEPTSCKGPCI